MMNSSSIPVVQPPIEFYLNVKQNGSIRCGIKGPFLCYDYTDMRGDGSPCTAWIDLRMPHALWTDQRGIAAYLSDAAMTAWNLANSPPFATQIQANVSIARPDGSSHLVEVRGGGNFGPTWPHENLLNVLFRVQTAADGYLGLIQKHGRKFPLN